jgi:hypothetical protein
MGLARCLSHSTLALNRGSGVPGDLVAATNIVSYASWASSSTVACLYPGSKTLLGQAIWSLGRICRKVIGLWTKTCSIFAAVIDNGDHASKRHTKAPAYILHPSWWWLVRFWPDICSGTWALRKRMIGCSGVTLSGACRLHFLVRLIRAALDQAKRRKTSLCKFQHNDILSRCW